MIPECTADYVIVFSLRSCKYVEPKQELMYSAHFVIFPPQILTSDGDNIFHQYDVIPVLQIND